MAMTLLKTAWMNLWWRVRDYWRWQPPQYMSRQWVVRARRLP